jgi:hypothetical protein
VQGEWGQLPEELLLLVQVGSRAFCCPTDSRCAKRGSSSYQCQPNAPSRGGGEDKNRSSWKDFFW